MVTLFMIFHSSFSEDIFQVQLKSTNASPIFKVSNIKEVGNCRPLSVLPIFPKVLERLMYNRTFQYFKKNYMLFPKRRDFEINNSMHHAILNLTNDRLTSSKKDQLTLGGFIDLLKKSV